ncbi:MAG: hypothetical protein HOO96_00015 [Polyangiaceae bacterium]|nr:hypothetical protein [Polyangiaceae bacterium]
MRIILEGLTGTGKSHTLSALQRLHLAPSLIVPEEETFGDLMAELATAPLEPEVLVRRLRTVCDGLPRDRSQGFILERFHLSYFALVPAWSFYEAIDAELAELGISIVLLTLPEEALETRSFRREEHDGADWQNLAAHYGSSDKAMVALQTSRARRLEALKYTRLRHSVIDTGDKDWDRYAKAIAANEG